VIIAGNNIYPEDLEAAIHGLAGVIPGRVVAFGEEDPQFGSERLSVVAETALTEEADRRKLRMESLSRYGNRPHNHHVYLVPLASW